MAGRVEDNNRRHIFDVIKVSTFGFKVPRIIVVERADATRVGCVCICGESGRIKRRLDPVEIRGVEEAPPASSSDDADRSLLFKYFDRKDTARVLLFVSKRQREAFVEEIALLNPNFVVRRKDGSLASAADRARKVSDARKAAIDSSQPPLPLPAGAASSPGEAAGSRGTPAAIVDATGDVNFFCMEENEWGFMEPRVLTFSDDGKVLHVVDATADGKGTVDVMLRRVHTIQLHKTDKTVMQLVLHDGSMINPAPAKWIVLTFGARASRDRLVDELRKRLGNLSPSVSYAVDDTWMVSLPTKLFFRFEAVRLKPRRLPCTLLVAPRRRRVHVIATRDIKNYEPGGVVPSGAPVDTVIGIVPNRLQLERNPRNARVLGISEQGASVSPAAREINYEFEFQDGAERERFACYMRAMATEDPPVGGAPARSATASPLPGASSTASSALTAGMSSRAGFRAPAQVDSSVLYAQLWPHDDVRMWIGTYNVSGTPPPSNLRELDKWIPSPTRDGEGAADMYVFGFQECGSAANREAWGAALVKHLAGAFTMKSVVSTGGDAESATPVSPPAAAAAVDPENAFVLVDYVYMWQMACWIFVRAPHVVDVTNVSHADLPTGIAVAKAITGVQLGNKGAVGISLRWRDTTLAFVLCHLPARPEVIRLRKREHDFKIITRKIKLETAMAGVGLDYIHQHDHVWFFGDLNYRVDLPFDRVVTLYKSKQFEAIMAHDQLLREQARGRVCVGFQEAHISFAPTYRWLRDTEEFSWKRGQAPSYTDRILHRSLPGIADRITQSCYNAGTFLMGSDHRPVGAQYTMSLRRYYCAPTIPLAYPSLPIPSFFTAVDSLLMPVPVLSLTNVKFSGVPALTAPAGVFISLHAPWLDGRQVHSGIMSAMGISTANKEALRSLRVELAAEKRRENARMKAEAKEAKAKLKAAKKEQKAKGEKEGPRVTIQGDSVAAVAGVVAAASPAPSTPSSRPTSISTFRAGTRSMSYIPRDLSAMLGAEALAEDAARLLAEDRDSDEDDEDDDESVTGREAEYSILDEDATYAASAAAAALEAGTMSAADAAAAGVDPKRQALLALQAEYAFVPVATAFPPLRPACWDPRVLRQSHLHVLIHASPGPDGSFLAIGGGKSVDAVAAGISGTDVVGQAVIPLAPIVRAACHAAELAYALQMDDDGSSTSSRMQEDELGAVRRRSMSGSSSAPNLRQLHSSSVPKPAARKSRVHGGMPLPLSMLEQERLAVTTGLQEAPPHQYARGFTPEGVPWALTAPPISISVNVELCGQVIGKLTAQAALRPTTDPTIALRLGGGFREAPCAWDFASVLAAFTHDYSARHGGVGDHHAVPRVPVSHTSVPAVINSTAYSRSTSAPDTVTAPAPPWVAPPLLAAADMAAALPPPPAFVMPPPPMAVLPPPPLLPLVTPAAPSPAEAPMDAAGAARRAAKPKAPVNLLTKPLAAGALSAPASPIVLPRAEVPSVPSVDVPAANEFPATGGASSAALYAPSDVPRKKKAAPAALLSSRIALAAPTAPGGPVAASSLDGGASAAILRRGSVTVAPQFQAFFEAQFARKLRLSSDDLAASVPPPPVPPVSAAATTASDAAAAGGLPLPPPPPPPPMFSIPPPPPETIPSARRSGAAAATAAGLIGISEDADDSDSEDEDEDDDPGMRSPLRDATPDAASAADVDDVRFRMANMASRIASAIAGGRDRAPTNSSVDSVGFIASPPQSPMMPAMDAPPSRARGDTSTAPPLFVPGGSPPMSAASSPGTPGSKPAAPRKLLARAASSSVLDGGSRGSMSRSVVTMSGPSVSAANSAPPSPSASPPLLPQAGPVPSPRSTLRSPLARGADAPVTPRGFFPVVLQRRAAASESVTEEEAQVPPAAPAPVV